MHEVIPYRIPKLNPTNSVAILILGLSFLNPANISGYMAMLKVLTNLE